MDHNCVRGDCLVTLTKPYYQCSCSHPYKLPDCQQGECRSAGTDPTLWCAVGLGLCWLQVPSAGMMLGGSCSVYVVACQSLINPMLEGILKFLQG